MKQEQKIKRRFLQLVDSGIPKEQVIAKMKKEFRITNYEIKLMANQLHRAHNISIDGIELGLGKIDERDNPCPECESGEIVCYTKPDGNVFCCNNCSYFLEIR